MDINISQKIKPYLLPAIINYSNWKEHISVCSEFVNWTDSAGIDLAAVRSEHIEKKIHQWQSESIDAWEINNKIWILKKFFSLYKPDSKPIKRKHFLNSEIGFFNKTEIREIENSLIHYPFVRAAYFFIKHYYFAFSKILSLSYKNVDLNRKIFHIDNEEFRFTNKAYEAIKYLSMLRKYQKETIFPSRTTMYRYMAQISNELGFYITYRRLYSNILLSVNRYFMGKNISPNRNFIRIAVLTGLRPRTIRTLIKQKYL